MHTKDESKRTSRLLNVALDVEQFAKKVSLLARGEDRSEELKQQYRSDLEFAMRSMKTLDKELESSRLKKNRPTAAPTDPSGSSQSVNGNWFGKRRLIDLLELTLVGQKRPHGPRRWPD